MRTHAIIDCVPFAGVVESADTRDLKSLDSDIVPVQVRSPAPNANNPNIHFIGEAFGFVFLLN